MACSARISTSKSDFACNPVIFSKEVDQAPCPISALLEIAVRTGQRSPTFAKEEQMFKDLNSASVKASPSEANETFPPLGFLSGSRALRIKEIAANGPSTRRLRSARSTPTATAAVPGESELNGQLSRRLQPPMSHHNMSTSSRPSSNWSTVEARIF
jgi:hypothetical protein